jgi:hypothetical protein
MVFLAYRYILGRSHKVTPLTMSQIAQKHRIELAAQVQRLREDAEALLIATQEQFGETDTRTWRAGEVCDALQRLRLGS